MLPAISTYTPDRFLESNPDKVCDSKGHLIRSILRVVLVNLSLPFLLLFAGCADSKLSQNPVEDGMQALSIFDFEEAYKQLSIAIEEMDSSDSRWSEVAYALGIAAWHRSPSRSEYIQEAVGLFEEVAASTEEEQLRSRCYLNLGRIAEVRDFSGDPKKLEEASSYYERALEAVPGTGIGSQAAFRLAQTRVDQMNDPSFEEAIEIVTGYLTDYPEAPFANVGWHFVADIEKYYLNDDESALEALRKAYALGFALESKADVYIWQMAELALELGETEEAVGYLSEVVRDYPRSVFRWVSREKLKELAQEYPNLNIEIPALTAYGEV